MSKENESFLSDEIEENPVFGFDDYATLLATTIRDPKLETPFTIAVYGNWGSGKTTLMKAIDKKLTKTSEELKIGAQDLIEAKASIWFNAWEFEKIQTPLWAIFLNRIISELQKQIMKPQKKRNKEIIALGKGLILLASEILLSKTIGIKTGDLERIKDKVWTDMENIQSLGSKLQGFVNQALGYDPEKSPEYNERLGRIVIFVDDLDRCRTEQSIHIFESIKLFLNCKNCVFVVGIDREQIRKIFQEKFESTDEARGVSYVEKFVQLEFDLPPKTKKEVKEFILKKAPSNLQEKVVELISESIEKNPRKIKRWLNSVLFLEKLFLIKKEELTKEVGKEAVEIDVSLASIWVFLKAYFTGFSNLITANESNLNKAIALAKDETKKEKIIDGFELDQRLINFLIRLEPDYDETQIEFIIHLSELAPRIISSEYPRIFEEKSLEVRKNRNRVRTLLEDLTVDKKLSEEASLELLKIRNSLDYYDNKIDSLITDFRNTKSSFEGGSLDQEKYDAYLQDIIGSMEFTNKEINDLNKKLLDIPRVRIGPDKRIK